MTVTMNRTLKKKMHWYNLGQRRCHCCGVQLNWRGEFKNSASIEHMIPKSLGGTYEIANILIVCRSCNGARGNSEWIGWVIKNDFPKKEWLIRKYIRAAMFYKKNSQVNISKNMWKIINKYCTDGM